MRGQLYSSRRSRFQTLDSRRSLPPRRLNRHRPKLSRLGPFGVNGIPAANTPSCCVAHPGHSSTPQGAWNAACTLAREVQLSDGRSESICISAGLDQAHSRAPTPCVCQWQAAMSGHRHASSWPHQQPRRLHQGCWMPRHACLGGCTKAARYLGGCTKAVGCSVTHVSAAAPRLRDANAPFCCAARPGRTSNSGGCTEAQPRRLHRGYVAHPGCHICAVASAIVAVASDSHSAFRKRQQPA